MNSILYRTRKAQPQSRQDRLRKSLVFTPLSNLTVDARWSASLPFPYCTSLHLFWPLIHFHEWLQLFPNRFMSHQDNQPLPFLAAFLSAVYSYVSNALFLQGLGRSLKTGEAKSKHRKWPIRRYLRAPLSRTYAHTCRTWGIGDEGSLPAQGLLQTPKRTDWLLCQKQHQSILVRRRHDEMY
jgi:hypothetical protein